MRITLLTIFATLLLSGCSGGGASLLQAEDVTDQVCTACGSECIPTDLLPFTQCEASTERFACELAEGSCVRK